MQRISNKLLGRIRCECSKVQSAVDRSCSKFSTMANKEAADEPIVPIQEAKRFMAECLEAVGAPKCHALLQAELLTEADYKGHYSHGMNRIEYYVGDIKRKTCDPNATPKILKETASTAWVDGLQGLGAVVGNFCMKLAIKKAKENGIGLVIAKGSNHYGIASKYTTLAIEEGLIGLSWSNTSPLMVPTRAKSPALGTNPLSVGAPAKDGDSLLLDMATTVVAVGKMEIKRREGKPLPEGWAVNESGEIETDAEKAMKVSRLMPLGGDETHSGFKGYGLGLVVEVLSGILGGSSYGPHIRRWTEQEKIANLGHGFLAINPNSFAPYFSDRLQIFLNELRSMAPVDPSKPVLVAGDPERAHMKYVDERGGITYNKNQLDNCEKLAKELNVKPLKFL